MNNNLQIFNSSDFGEIRAAVKDGEPYFCLADVCRVLEIRNSTDVKNRLSRDGVDSIEVIDSIGRKQSATFVSEPNLYKVIFQSRKPEAEKFADWVTSEVLPAIRKHGAYATPTTIENIIANPSNAIKLLQALAEEQNKNNELKVENSQLRVDKQIMQPKADYFDELVDRNLLVSFTEASKQLGVKRKDVINFCLDHGYLYRDKKNKLLPRANKKARDLFQVVQCYNEKTKWAGSQTLLTPKGIETLRLLMLDA